MYNRILYGTLCGLGLLIYVNDSEQWRNAPVTVMFIMKSFAGSLSNYL